MTFFCCKPWKVLKPLVLLFIINIFKYSFYFHIYIYILLIQNSWYDLREVINMWASTQNSTIIIFYCTILSTMGPIFSEFLIFCRLISRVFRGREILENMRNEENTGQIVQGKRSITSLSLTYEISTVC